MFVNAFSLTNNCVFILAVKLCGYSGYILNNRIVGGEDTIIQMWPWQVMLVKLHQGLAQFKCGGTLITERHILTAAHCFTAASRYSSLIILSF